MNYYFKRNKNLISVEIRLNYKKRVLKMKTQHEVEEDIVMELEKLCGEWNIYEKRVERVRQ